MPEQDSLIRGDCAVVLPSSPTTVDRPKPVTGRREALNLIDRFLMKPETKKKLGLVMESWLDDAPRDFVRRILLPLLPKEPEGTKAPGAVVNVITGIPRPGRGPQETTIEVVSDGGR